MLLAVKLLFEWSKSFFRDYEQSLFFISPSSETKMTTWVIEGSRLRRVHSPQWIWRTRETARSLRFLRHNKQLKIAKDYRYITDWRTYESHCWLKETPSNHSLCNTSFDKRCVLAGANISGHLWWDIVEGIDYQLRRSITPFIKEIVTSFIGLYSVMLFHYFSVAYKHCVHADARKI